MWTRNALKLAAWLKDMEAHQAKRKRNVWREAKSQMKSQTRKRSRAGHGSGANG